MTTAVTAEWLCLIVSGSADRRYAAGIVINTVMLVCDCRIDSLVLYCLRTLRLSHPIHPSLLGAVIVAAAATISFSLSDYLTAVPSLVLLLFGVRRFHIASHVPSRAACITNLPTFRLLPSHCPLSLRTTTTIPWPPPTVHSHSSPPSSTPQLHFPTSATSPAHSPSRDPIRPHCDTSFALDCPYSDITTRTWQ